MDITKSELPLTSFWDLVPNSKKKENQAPAGKRKRNDIAEATSSLKGKGKQILQDDTIVRSRVDAKKPKHVYGKPRPSANKGKGKASVHPDIRSFLQGASSGVDYDAERSDGGGPSKRRRVETSTSPSGRGIPTPPPTNGAKKARHSTQRGITAPRAPPVVTRTAHNLPTPCTSVPRHVGRSPSKPPLHVALSSPLAARHAPNSRDPSSSPLSSCPDDDLSLSHSGSEVTRQSHANIAQALIDATPKSHDRPAVDHHASDKVSNNDPFLTPVVPAFVPTSQRFEDNLPLPSVDTSYSVSPHDREILVTTSPMAEFAVPTALNSIISPRRSIVESSQSQYLLRNAESPRRNVAKYSSRDVVESSQSQALLPHSGSPRRSISTHAPQDIVESSQSQGQLSALSSRRRRRLSESSSGISPAGFSQVVEGSQSQTERELMLSTDTSQLCLLGLPNLVSSPEEISNDHQL